MEDICRICLNLLANKTTVSIYNRDSDDMKLFLKINDVSGIFIPEKDESLPNFICLECCENLNKSYKFRNLCRASDVQLKKNLLIKLEPAMPIKDCDTDSENLFNYSNNSFSAFPENNDSDSEETHNAENFKIEIVEKEHLEETNIKFSEQQKNTPYNLKLIFQYLPQDSGVKKYLCKICKKTISGKKYHLNRHLQNGKHQSKLLLMKESAEENLELTEEEMKKKNSFICEVCGKVFNQKYKLTNHKLLHIDVKLHKCETCNKRFHSRLQMNRHIRVHTGEKPYKCSFCEKYFAHFNSKKQHEKTHTNERPFPCVMCDKRFRQRVARANHMKIHTGEKPFSCDICNLSFIKKYHIDRHYRSKSHQKLLKEKE